MKRILLLLIGFGITNTAPSLAAYNGLLERADEQYSKRDFTEEGIRSAADARYNYDRVATTFMSNVEGQYAIARVLRANHFVGNAVSTGKAKIFMDGFATGQRAILWFENKFGRNPLTQPSMDERGKKIFADMIIHHAFNTKDWIRENGGGYEGEWRKVERFLDQIISAGLDHVAEYGVRRVLAERALEKGNYSAALTHLEIAFRGMQAKNIAGISGNGFVNYFLAIALEKTGRKDRAISLLQSFVKANIEDLSIDFQPENRKYKAMAKDLLRSWGALASRPISVKGEYVVKLSAEGMRAFSGSISAKNFDFHVKEKISPRHLLVTLPENETTNSFNTLSAHPFVELAEPNYLYYTSRVVNDPRFSECWGMRNTGQLDPRGAKGVAGVDVRANEAWDLSTGLETVVVAVIDTGVDFTHPDLAHAAWVNEAEANGKPGVDDDGNGYVDDLNGYNFADNKPIPFDDHGHGTHVAGVIAAKGNDALGIAGVAWNTKIMGLKFLGANGSGSLDMAMKAIQYATRMGAKITNNSWGGGGESKILRDSIEEAGRSGSLFVAAAGNSGENTDTNPEYPAGYKLPNIISVAALDNRGRLSNFSNYGTSSVHIAAPGQNILSSVPGGAYESMSGTSMAAPFVAGAAALLMAREPGLSPVEIKARLMKTSSPLLSLRGRTASGGMVNTFNALKDQTTPKDPNDPESWEVQAYSLTSQQPYTPDSDQTWEVQIPGAKQVSLFFNLFDVERGYDRVFFYDGAGNFIGMWTDARAPEWSPVAEGDTLKIRFVSDHSVQGQGFSAEKVAVKRF